MPDASAGYTIHDAPPLLTWQRSGTWDEALIPPRPWIAPGYMLRGAVTLLIGPGGVSKSTLTVAQAVALALDHDMHGFHPRGRRRVALFNVEDDGDEQERRLSAALIRLGRTPADVADVILRTGPTRTGQLFNRDPMTGQVEPTPAMVKLENDLVAFGVDVLFVDPLTELHGSEENDNGAMRAIVAAFRAFAVRLNIAVVIVHHTRKGAATPGDPDAGRGASSIVGACRVVLTVTSMTKEEAEALGIDPAGARAFFRLDGGKSNYAALTACEWFERVEHTLANGDRVSAVAPWEPPRQVVTLDMRLQVEAAIRRGSSEGPWSVLLGASTRSIRVPLEAAGISGKVAQRDMIAALQREGYGVFEFRDRFRKLVKGIRSSDGLPKADWSDREDSDEPA